MASCLSALDVLMGLGLARSIPDATVTLSNHRYYSTAALGHQFVEACRVPRCESLFDRRPGAPERRSAVGVEQRRRRHFPRLDPKIARRGDRYRCRLKETNPKPIRPAENATINRELALLKHAFHLGWQSTPRKVAVLPYIPCWRSGTFDAASSNRTSSWICALRAPEYLRPVLTFAYYTGCQRGEILALQRPQIDLKRRVVRLEPGTTKSAWVPFGHT